MTAELTAFFDRSMAAERVGDAAEALAYHDGIPMFRRSRHRALLTQLAGVREELTPWAWARWIVYQSIRSEDPGSQTGQLLHAAMAEATSRFHGDLMSAAYDRGRDPIQVHARVMGESWGCHQLAVYEYGVLESFLDELAGGELADSAELARAWVRAPMHGYQWERPARPGELRVRDLATDMHLDVLDLGSATVARPSHWVIGRLVPSGTTPALMFDTAPLQVHHETAREVAHCRAPDEWVEVLDDAIASGRMSGSDLLREDYEILTDIPALALVEFGTRRRDLPRVLAQLVEGRDEIGRAAFRILRRAADGSLEDAAAPFVASAVLNAHAHAEAPRLILASGQQPAWIHWAKRVPQPARGRLLRFADLTAEAA
jgi:hypothetical protein